MADRHDCSDRRRRAPIGVAAGVARVSRQTLGRHQSRRRHTAPARAARDAWLELHRCGKRLRKRTLVRARGGRPFIEVQAIHCPP